MAGAHGLDLGGRTSPPELASVLAAADAAVAPNTGPAHLAAAVGTPVVSLFSRWSPAERWAPYGGAARAPSATRAPPAPGPVRAPAPVPGHPCLDEVTAEDVAAAVGKLLEDSGAPAARAGGPQDSGAPAARAGGPPVPRRRSGRSARPGGRGRGADAGGDGG